MKITNLNSDTVNKITNDKEYFAYLKNRDGKSLLFFDKTLENFGYSNRDEKLLELAEHNLKRAGRGIDIEEMKRLINNKNTSEFVDAVLFQLLVDSELKNNSLRALLNKDPVVPSVNDAIKQVKLNMQGLLLNEIMLFQKQKG